MGHRRPVGRVVDAQNPADDIFVDLNSEEQRDLLGDAGTAPRGIVAFHRDNGIDKFFVLPFRARPAAAFRRKRLVVLSFVQ